MRKGSIREWTEDEINWVRENYCNKNIPKEIFEEKLDMRWGYIISRVSKLKLGYRKHSLNEDYFSEMNTWKKWYFLGWLFTDGHVHKHKNNNSVSMELQEEDEYILKAFKKDIELVNDNCITTRKGRKHNWKDTKIFSFSSKKVTQDLKKLGMVPTKSLILEFPKNIPKEFESAFLLGCFDGDGCIHIDQRGYGEFAFIGTFDMCENFQKVLIENCSVNKIKIQKRPGDKNTYHFKYGGIYNCLRIQDYLYKNAEIYLTRKREKFNKIKKAEKNENNKCGHRS